VAKADIQELTDRVEALGQKVEALRGFL